jgi:hypothetical protein
MIHARRLKQLFKKCGRDPVEYEKQFRHALGLRWDDVKQRSYVDLEEAEFGTDEFSIRDQATGWMGHEWVESLGNRVGGMSGAHAETLSDGYRKRASLQSRHRNLTEEYDPEEPEFAGKVKTLIEDTVGLSPSVFADINAWTATVQGLVEIRKLAAMQRPEFIWENFVEVQPTRVNGGKVIGIPYVGDYARKVQPGIAFPNVGLSQLYSWIQPNDIYGLSLALDRNAIVYDLSGELMAAADTTGAALGYRREVIVAQGVLGITAYNSFIMGGNISDTPNATYQTTKPALTPATKYYQFINKQANPLSDYTSLQTAQNLFNLMRDPVNNLPFNVSIEDILISPNRLYQVQTIQHALQVLNWTGTAGPSPNTVPPQGTFAANPIGNFRIHQSIIWDKVQTDNGVSDADRDAMWFAGKPKNAFVWRSAWDMRTDQANPTSAEMLATNVVNMWVSQWSGQFGVRDARWFSQQTRT